MTGDDRLRGELEALERAAPAGGLPVVEAVRPRPWGRIGLIGATVVAAVALSSLAFGLGRSIDVGSRSSSPLPSGPSANPPAVAETRIGDFILTISSPKIIWTTAESIEVSASLTYAGSDSAVQIGAGVHPVVFSVKDVNSGETVLNGAQLAICLDHELVRGEPLRQPFVKAGEVAPTGPFDNDFFADSELRMPLGEWEFRASASLSCDSESPLQVSIILRVVAPPSTPIPSTDRTPEPSEPLPSPTSQGRVCMAALAHGVLDADADGNPVLIMGDGMPTVSIVFSYPEDVVIESAPELTIYDRDGNVLAREGDEVELGGGFNADDTIFYACGIHQVLPGGASVQCGLGSHECDAALSAFGQIYDLADPGLEDVVVTVGRGLAWHVEVHACWVDGRYVLVDVLGDRYGPTDDLRASVRPDGWNDPPCSLSEARTVPGQPPSSASAIPRSPG